MAADLLSGSQHYRANRRCTGEVIVSVYWFTDDKKIKYDSMMIDNLRLSVPSLKHA